MITVDNSNPSKQLIGSNIILKNIAGSTYLTVQDMQNLFHSTGWISGGIINDNGSATITVNGGTGLIRISNSQTAELQFFNWSALGSTAIPTNSIRYIGVEYNSGSPQIVAHTSYDWNFNTDFPLGNVVNLSDVLHIENIPHAVGDHANFMIQRLKQTMPYKRDEVTGGLILSETGTRNMTVSAGAVWQGLTRFAISAIDTSASSTFTTWYYNGTSWVETTGATQWPNTQYNNVASGLTNMSAAQYANLYFYLETDGDLEMVYGQAQYATIAQADAETPPSLLPDKITKQAWLIGRLTFQKSAATAAQIESVYTSIISLTGATSHTNLSNLAWTSSNHTGTASRIAGFDGSGAAAEYAIGTDIQAYDATLQSISALGTAADKMMYTTGVDIWAETGITAFARSILDDDSEATFKATVNLEIGVDVQAYDADLTTIAGLSSADSNFIVGSAGGWVVESGATVRTSLGLAIGTDVQAYDATLTSIALLGTAADKMLYTTGIDTWAETGITAFARSILDDDSEATFKATVNLEIGTDVQAYDAELAAIAGLVSAANKIPYFTGLGTADMFDFKDEDNMISNSATALASQQSIKAYVDAQTAGANTALSNLASVAINTSLISDTDITDDLGSSAIRWRDIYAATLRTGDTATDTLLLQARDVDGASWTTFATLTAGNAPTMNLSTAVTIGGNNIAIAGNNTNITSLAACGSVDAGVNVLNLTGTTEVVVNDASEDVDFRVESNTDANALFVDGANGVVTLASQPSARMTRITTAQSIPSGVTTKVQYNGESWDVGSNFDSTTNYRFTAPVAGKYFVTGAVMFSDSLGVGDIVVLGFYINGALHSQSRLIIGVAGTYQRLAHTDLVNLGANDYVEAFVTQSNAASRDLNPNPADTYLSIQKLS